MKLRYLLFFIFPLFLASCEDNKEPREKTYSTDPSTKHTLLIYLGIDNNFSDERDKIEILRRNWNTDYDANLLVYADGITQTVLVHIHHDKYGNNIADTVKVNAAEDSGSPQVFNRVLKEAYEGWPATQKGLVILSHATGWLTKGKLGDPMSRTVINDRNGSDLDLWDFAENIPTKLDYIVFDACLMAGVEVMSELRPKADYVVACPSEILKRYIQYETMVDRLVKNTFPDFKGIVDDTYQYAMTRYDDKKYHALTMSVVDLGAFDQMEEFCRDVFPVGDFGVQAALTAKGKKVRDLQQFYPAHYRYPALGLYTDLGDIVEILAPERYPEFLKILAECVFYEKHTDYYYSDYNAGNHAINSFSGLTMYIMQDGFDKLNGEYKVLEWYKKVIR